MIEAREYEHRVTRKILAIFDSETDPFAEDRIVKPFTCGFYRLDTGDYEDFWGADCIAQFFTHLDTLTAQGLQFIVFCHNLGGFDVHLGMLDYLDAGTSPTIINGRLSVCSLAGQEFRDSYRIFPEALAAYAKDKFDYAKMEADVREAHKDEILLYQRHDCVYLGDLVQGFFDLFGDRPTIGNTAISYLQNFHGFERMNQGQDQQMRPFFFGGRCQVFKTGVTKRPLKVYDVNGMYMSVMRDMPHPISAAPIIGRGMFPTTAFVDWEGENQGAVPMRADDGSLDFTVTSGRFLSTMHELRAGEETGRIRIHRVHKTIGFTTWGTFAEFVNYCQDKKVEALANGDAIRALFWKRLGNSAYGKFAQDPRRYERYIFSLGNDGIPEMDQHFHAEDNPRGFSAKFCRDQMVIWAKPSPNRFNGFFNCATGASITGAARSVLLRGLSAAQGAVYSDTDSIICEGLRTDGRYGVAIDGSHLGAWKLEAEGEVFACAGKKLYALFAEHPPVNPKTGVRGIEERWSPTAPAYARPITIDGRPMWCVKKASKGAVLTSEEIYRIALGEKVRYKSIAPNFKLDGSVEFIERVIEKTG